MIHHIELDTIRKHRSEKEWRNINRARCGDFEETGDGRVIVNLCRKMADSGLSGEVEVWRGAQLVFPAYSLEKWAAGKLSDAEQPEHLRKPATGQKTGVCE